MYIKDKTVKKNLEENVPAKSDLHDYQLVQRSNQYRKTNGLLEL